MRRDLRRVRNWIRGLVLAVIAMLGLVAIVGSGGGGGGSHDDDAWCPVPNCDVPPTFEVQPKYATALVGTRVTFTVAASDSDDGFSYQWLRRGAGEGTFEYIVGANGRSYSIAAVNLADDGAVFRVQVYGGGPLVVIPPLDSQLAVSATPGLVFKDGDFQPANWTVSTIAGPNPIAPVHIEERIESGGNPGAFRKMVFDIPQDARIAFVVYLSPSAYDPVSQGAVSAIDYAEDCITPQRSGTEFVVSKLVLQQGTRTYVSPATEACKEAVWNAVGLRDSLRAEDFQLIDGPACGAGESCPDFSTIASSMRFGYLRTAYGEPGQFITHGIDNWKVTVWRR